jgi:hypothetical protein
MTVEAVVPLDAFRATYWLLASGMPPIRVYIESFPRVIPGCALRRQQPTMGATLEIHTPGGGWIPGSLVWRKNLRSLTFTAASAPEHAQLRIALSLFGQNENEMLR